MTVGTLGLQGQRGPGRSEEDTPGACVARWADVGAGLSMLVPGPRVLPGRGRVVVHPWPSADREKGRARPPSGEPGGRQEGVNLAVAHSGWDVAEL